MKYWVWRLEHFDKHWYVAVEETWFTYWDEYEHYGPYTTKEEARAVQALLNQGDEDEQP